jgi:hypothetical protein
MPLKHNAYFQQCYHLAGSAVSNPIVQRDDGMWSIGWHDDAPGPFESRRFAEAVGARTALVRQ